ncbi:Cell division protein FtsX [Polaribacter huanghezhanensis]|uniref:cell division protein FtsX n=1 Tax=Polaribacter huanghezhanensis TaxID=1354726 RepID=UPI00264826FB|nr:permease-like cell division protein FtsX [Polaribacter huanghezhanensis]WKD85698.1 Cell division protein FtsX [Polaribacter huanghezhanensis]
MSTSFDKYQKRRLRSSYFSVIVSISLVLFMVGVLGLILLKSTSVANHVKEKTAMTLFLKDNVTKKNIEDLRTSLLKEKFTKQIVYISKEEAAKFHSKDLGEDFVQFLGTNPLKNGIDIYVKAEFVTPEKMAEIEKKFQKNAFVLEVSYDKPLIEFLTKNIQKISFWLLVVSAFFALISILLINSALRLSVYSKRFNIKTMQMVGATKSFIRKPFILQGMKLGLIGSIISLIGLGTVIYYTNKYIPALQLLNDYALLSYLFGGVLVVAFLITWLSTYFATQRFLNLQTDELYY